jgi:tetratricopeptide (TPR) repeat protein
MVCETCLKPARIPLQQLRFFCNTDNLHRVAGDFLGISRLAPAIILLLLLGQTAFGLGAESVNHKLIHGVITTRDDRPVAAATIEICDLTGNRVAVSVTDAEGRFEIRTDAMPGEYVLLIANSRQLHDERISLGRTDVEIKLSVSGSSNGVARQSRFSVSSRQLGIPAKARARVASAQEQFKKLNLPQATRELNIALRIDPSCSEAWSMRAFVELAAKNLPGAVADASHAAALDPDNADAYLALGTAYNSMNDFKHAERALSQALDLRPDTWQAQLEIAKTWYGQKRLVLALRQLEILNRDFPDVHLVRANVMMSLGRDREGAEEFSIFLREAPGDRRGRQIQKILAQIDPATSAAPPN